MTDHLIHRSKIESLERRAKESAENFLALLDAELLALRTLDEKTLQSVSERKAREAEELNAHIERSIAANGELSAELSALLRMCEAGNNRNGILVYQGLRNCEQMLSILHGNFEPAEDLLYQKNGAMLAGQRGTSLGISA